MADDLMRELAPLLAEDGIDLDDPDSIPDMETLQRALDSAVKAVIRRRAGLDHLRLSLSMTCEWTRHCCGVWRADSCPTSPAGREIQPWRRSVGRARP